MDWAWLHYLLHLDTNLQILFQSYGNYIYLFLFLIIFAETGLIVTPFLPGDSLLFAAGSVAANSNLSIHYLALLLFFAAILGDSFNYFVGKRFGIYLLQKKSRFLKPKHVEKTSQFFTRYGAKTIIIARFLPIVRTYAPFLAGIGRMSYPTFITFNLIGAALWIGSLSYAGYFFGRIPLIATHFEWVILSIIAVSLLLSFFSLRKTSAKT